MSDKAGWRPMGELSPFCRCYRPERSSSLHPGEKNLFVCGLIFIDLARAMWISRTLNRSMEVKDQVILSSGPLFCDEEDEDEEKNLQRTLLLVVKKYQCLQKCMSGLPVIYSDTLGTTSTSRASWTRDAVG
jgi:hypothetical protein